MSLEIIEYGLPCAGHDSWKLPVSWRKISASNSVVLGSVAGLFVRVPVSETRLQCHTWCLIARISRSLVDEMDEICKLKLVERSPCKNDYILGQGHDRNELPGASYSTPRTGVRAYPNVYGDQGINYQPCVPRNSWSYKMHEVVDTTINRSWSLRGATMQEMLWKSPLVFPAHMNQSQSKRNS